METLELNEPQREAVEYLDGHLLVIAGAGSGKTRVLTSRIAYLIQQGVSPYHIMALTFTNKAANEMKSRVVEQITATGNGMEHIVRGLTMGTFHSVFLRILSREVDHTDYHNDFTIYDASDSRSLIKTIVKEMGLDEKVYKPQLVANRISDAKNKLLLPAQYANTPSALHFDEVEGIRETHRIYTEYRRRCILANAMDFDDLLLNTYLLFLNHNDIRLSYAHRYPHILVDEYQDTNYAQHQILRQLTTKDSKVCVVGDDAQSIYAFRGAEIDNILRFAEEFKGAKIVKLERNYRSTQTIVEAANSIIVHNRRQIPKRVYSENELGQKIPVIKAYSDKEEGLKIANQIRKLRLKEAMDYGQIAILYRTNAQSRSIEEGLRNSEIPYRIYGGLSFYQRKEIKDVLAYMRVVCNPADEEAIHRILNYPARGIGKTTEQKLQLTAIDHGVSLWEVLVHPEQYTLSLHKATLSKLEVFRELIDSFRKDLATCDGYELTARIIRESGISAEYLKEPSPENKSALENLEELLGAIGGYAEDVREETGRACVTLPEFLGQISLLTDTEETESDASKVTLMTVHAAKGLEFDCIFVTGMEEDLFPAANARYNSRELEEERRLFYVAVTRARKNCYLTYAMSRFKYGQFTDCYPSPFLDEIDKRFLDSEGNAQSSRGKSSATRIPVQQAPVWKKKPFGNAPQESPFAPSSYSPGRFRKITPSSLSSSKAKDVPSQNGQPSYVKTAAGETIQAGIRVHHERFGTGKVLGIDGNGDSIKAIIDFDLAGRKTLLLKYAKLRVE